MGDGMTTRDHLSKRKCLFGMSSTIPDNQDRQSLEHKTNYSDYQQRQKPVEFTSTPYRHVLRNITATLEQVVHIVYNGSNAQ